MALRAVSVLFIEAIYIKSLFSVSQLKLSGLFPPSSNIPTADSKGQILKGCSAS